ncbi:hypothetical protein [Tropicibacter naphthalenivorans]|uniref:dTDP-4-dehydrorhamnose reductase n=1 Tax=Tropicibacter naphthalenivorans TaxID=441103 RepID=A0A0P1H0N9_9RHOB|nr:hypothetical protein [Tropicibacter naphthalenivorans]CUH79813.1 dTDP-4-dehydrorhamnose reductase [Tropicibacter naphthalenivorans]SMC75336.1 dTDP-4-dehydrorhamnose reductase [Tropicibacter naphthalenivorans]
MVGRVLILGGSGRFGRNMAEAFWNAGWSVTLHDRKRGDLTADAEGVDVIVHGWNPPYDQWEGQVAEQMQRVIAAAKASRATILYPGNVYVFGADAAPDFGPHQPHGATNPMGQIRINAERALRDSGCRVILLRAGDFLDTQASGNWFDMQMAKTLKKGVLTYPGDPDVPHAWAFLPDMARAAVKLVERRDSLPTFADIAFPGYTLTGRALAELCAQAIQKPVQVKRMSWLPLQVLRPFWGMARRLLEMRYLWDKPHFLTEDSLAEALPDFTATDPAEAVAAAVAPVLGQGPDQPKQGDAARRPARAV